MKEIYRCKFSLFRLEKQYHRGLSYVGMEDSIMTERCFEYIEAYDTLEEAKIAQKELKQKSIILPSY